eukprot:GHVH01015436.1.p2 GENE.GHVH01015436.1~~GHVH01015436.1.p2  ORF type:complete len:363 (-),score=72.64 GHVH01015436.1:1223-2311(-)
MESDDRESSSSDEASFHGQEESMDSLGSDGMVQKRSRRLDVVRRKVNDNTEDEFWNQDAWRNDEDEDWETSDEDKYKDVIDDDFDVSESESLEDLIKAGTAEDKRLLRESRGMRDKRKVDLESQKRLLKVFVDSLNYVPPPPVKEDPITSKLMVASDFNMPANYVNTTFKGMRWNDVVASANEARKRESHGKRAPKRKALTQASFLSGYKLQIAATRKEQENRQKAIFWKEYTNGKEKASSGPSEQSALRNGPSEMWVSWDSTRLIDKEDSDRKARGLSSFADADPVERQMSFMIDIPSESKGLTGHHCPAVLKQTPPIVPVQPKCVITGLEARYRDPVSQLGFHDVSAYRALKERRKAGTL